MTAKKPTFTRTPGTGRNSPQDVNRIAVNARQSATAVPSASRQSPVAVVSNGGAGGNSAPANTYTAVDPIFLAGGAFYILPADAVTNGYLLSVDWATFNSKEPALGNPSVSGYVLSSTTGGVRSWVAQSGGAGSGLFSYAIVAPPALASFTWLNQGASSAQNNNSGAITMNIVDQVGGGYRVLYKTAPATPYTVTVLLKSIQHTINSQTSSLFFRDSVSGHMISIDLLSAGSLQVFRVQRQDNVIPTAETNAYISPGNIATGSAGFQWFRIRNNGTTLFFDLSIDGTDWRNLWSEAVGSWLTPDEIGWGGISVTGNASAFVDVSLLSWSVM
jgi:hypothetical protein